MPTPEPRKSQHFARYLNGFTERGDRASLAALRRGLGKHPGDAAEMFPYLARWTLSPWEEETYYLVASLFARHQVSWPGDGPDRNLGASLARLNVDGENPGIERRFVALLNADREDAPDHLRHLIARLRTHEIPIDWACLIDDLNGWGSERRYVQRRWARSFWGAQPITVADNDTAIPVTTSEWEG